MLNRSSGLPVFESQFFLRRNISCSQKNRNNQFVRLKHGLQKVTKPNSNTSGNNQFYHDWDVSYLTEDIAYYSVYCSSHLNVCVSFAELVYCFKDLDSQQY